MKIFFFILLMFIWGVQPLMMISMLILITLFYSFIVFMNMGSYWFSYMLMLVMLSGVLIMFTYMVSLIPNEEFEMEKLFYLSVIIMLMFMKYSDKNFFNYEDLSFLSYKVWLNFMSIYNFYLLIFLFMIMVMVIWLSKLGEGALRNYKLLK